MKIVATALVAVSLLAGSTGAFAKERQGVQIRVSTDGVNFADPGSVAKFRSRLNAQIDAACNPADEIMTGRGPDLKCRKSLGYSADTRIAMLSGNATSQMAIVE